MVKEGSVRGAQILQVPVVPVGEEGGGERTAEGTVVLTGVQKDWLVRTAAGYAPEVKVLDPPEVRTDIINLLRTAANHNGAE